MPAEIYLAQPAFSKHSCTAPPRECGTENFKRTDSERWRMTAP
jgi:hypothetical protein